MQEFDSVPDRVLAANQINSEAVPNPGLEEWVSSRVRREKSILSNQR